MLLFLFLLKEKYGWYPKEMFERLRSVMMQQIKEYRALKQQVALSQAPIFDEDDDGMFEYDDDEGEEDNDE